MGVWMMLYGVPRLDVGVSLVDLSLRAGHVAAAEWGNALTGPATIGIGFVLALCCYITSVYGLESYISVVSDFGDCD